FLSHSPLCSHVLHSFPTRRSSDLMRDWYKEGSNPQSRLPDLATYLGHKDINSTLVYLNSTPELLQQASERFRQKSGKVLRVAGEDRKSTRLNSSHVKISYAVFCLK